MLPMHELPLCLSAFSPSCIFASLPFCLLAFLPSCLSAFLPFSLSPFLPFSLFASLPFYLFASLPFSLSAIRPFCLPPSCPSINMAFCICLFQFLAKRLSLPPHSLSPFLLFCHKSSRKACVLSFLHRYSLPSRRRIKNKNARNQQPQKQENQRAIHRIQ